MSRCRHPLPGFRATCLTVGGLHVALAGMLLLRGVRPSMAQFAVPDAILDSPHYNDAIFWVYSHQIVIGLILGVLGLRAEDGRLKLWMARLLFAAHAYYAYLDLRASDSPLGTGLYQGPASLIPAAVGLVMMLLFAHLSLCAATGADDRPARPE